MSHVAVITDTDSSLPVELAAEFKILQVPITVHFGLESYTTGVDINDITLFEKIDRISKLPTTSAPAPKAFVTAFREALDAGASSIVCICVSSLISSTYNAAVTASEEFPDVQITVVDSLCVSIGQGLMVLAAARVAAAGGDHESVVAAVNSYKGRVHTYGSLTTLKYLAMSGRVSKIAAGMAGMLNIRPILKSFDGKLELLEKVRTRRAAMDRLVELVEAAANHKPLVEVAFVHVNNLEDAQHLHEQLRAHLSLPENVIIAEFTPGLSVHTGSGLIGVAFVTGE